MFVQSWSALEAQTGEAFTLFFVEVTPTDLVFERYGDGFLARYHVDVVLFDEARERVGEEIFQDSLAVERYEDTQYYDWNRLFRVVFNLEAGNYTAHLHFVDDNAQLEAVKSYDFQVNRGPEKSFEVSEILLAREDEVENPDKSITPSVLPFPPAIYGADQERMFTYFEIYPQNMNETDEIEYTLSVIDQHHQQTILRKETVSSHLTKIPVMNVSSTADMPPGSYTMLLQISSTNALYELERSTAFLVYQSPVNLRFKSFETVLMELRLIADREEMALLSAADAIERQAAIHAFWSRRDPTPDTITNELMSEFYRRVNFSNYLYGDLKDDDFTDQAKVFILLGEPDEITRQQLNDYHSQLEIWHYYGENRMEVIFKDEAGVGSYRLVEPYSLLKDL